MNILTFAVIFLILADFMVSAAADLLNLKALSPFLPEGFQDVYDKDKYLRSQKYLFENTRFSLVRDGFFVSLLALFIMMGGFEMTDALVHSAEKGEVASGLMFAGILFLLLQLLGIPFSAYRIFRIEAKYGFNKTTVKTFATDIFKGLFLSALLGGGLFAGLTALFERGGEKAFLAAFLSLAGFQLVMVFLAPAVILPLFNKYTPLEDGELKTKIEDYARSQGFGLQGLYRVDASRRSTKSNAFFTGFGRFRRIALFDTLIEKHTADEIVSVLAHEIGHYKKKHVLQGLCISLAMAGIFLMTFSLFLKSPLLFKAFRMTHPSVYASLVLFAVLFSPLSTLISFFMNSFSRRNEYQADRFAVQTTGKPDVFISALKKLSVDNLSNLTPHPFKVLLDYTHPPVLKRIEEIKKSK